MKKYLYASTPDGLKAQEWQDALRAVTQSLGADVKRVLLVAPDNTRGLGMAGTLTNFFYQELSARCTVHVLIGLGAHMPMTDQEIRDFFGDAIPLDHYIQHDWRNDVEQIGVVPAEVVFEISNGRFNKPIEVEVNKAVASGNYDQIISIGQVVPHEILGMANFSKSFFVGAGGYNLISKTHILAPLCGAEFAVGNIDNPVRKVFDYAHTHFLKDLPILFIMTVTTLSDKEEIRLEGLFIGETREAFEQAAALSAAKNMIYIDKPQKKVVTCLDEVEFRSTWVGDKAIQRTHTIMAEGGELIILAPGIKQFGDDEITDQVMRKYGYIKKAEIAALINDPTSDLAQNLAAAGQLMVTSPDGRFKVTYAVKHLTREEVEGVGFNYMDYYAAKEYYAVDTLKEGYNTMPDGEEIYFIKNPGMGFWSIKE